MILRFQGPQSVDNRTPLHHSASCQVHYKVCASYRQDNNVGKLAALPKALRQDINCSSILGKLKRGETSGKMNRAKATSFVFPDKTVSSTR